ncbi:DUF932 domain-containing protein [Umezawaea sp. Da 62-37]|uniref:DUF932 domain-containing protein n=1 Tax=Umezawaea sp. Da 62-37 TaxID=3075927 RepID=UPI0028F72DB9|nr:DUF932 domain-containing protein [Umezawaea sp. Da 62-37]WNV85075.1 DUF932 domain-containing protein [Umezawaea sp. Da 62-37]
MTTTEMTTPFTRRPQLSLDELLQQLREQQARQQDMVIPAHKMRITPEGHLEVDQPRLSVNGVDPTTLFDLSRPFDAGIAGKLGVPAIYITRLRQHGMLSLFADNVNAWLAQEPNKPFLVRTFSPRDNEDQGLARALLSDSYAFRDNLPLLTAVLDGIADRAADVEISGELTERRMYLRVFAPTITAEAPHLLEFYRSPFNGQFGRDNPVVAAGFEVTNSELSFGASTITPKLRVQVCDNGLTITEDALRTIHTGAKLDHGVVRYSVDTIRKELETATARTRDAARTFLDLPYMARKLDELARRAEVQVIDPKATIEHVGKVVGYTKTEQDVIFAHFTRGADPSAGGVLHAVTSAAQVLSDADAAYDMERSALKALTVAAAFQR